MRRSNEFGQELLSGSGALNFLPEYLRQKRINSLIVVKGHQSFPAIMKSDFWPRNVTVITVEVDKKLPDINEIKQKYQMVKTFLPSVIVAVGGGSVMDTAKTIIYHSVKDGLVPSELIAIPTTAGSGSEATPFAVVYSEKQKLSLEATAILPGVVFLDPGITATLTSLQKAISGLDAWCQAIESFWSNKSTEKTRLLSRKAFGIILKELSLAVKQEEEPVSLDLLMGAHYAGQAISSTYTTGAHALSYHLTAEFGVPHGQAVGVFLPVMLLYNSYVHGVNTGVTQLPDLFGVHNMDEVIKKTITFIRSIGLKAKLRELNLQNLDVDILIDSVNMQRFSNNPRPYDRSALLDYIKWSLNENE